MAKACGLAALLLAAMLSVITCSPFGGANAFTCDSDDQCQTQGVDGRCESTGFCSFLDEGRCGPGGRAYGDLSGSLAGTCVGSEPPPEAGVDAPDAPSPEAGEVCFGSANGLAQPCFAQPPSGAITLDAAIDTDTSSLCSTVVSNTQACVIAGGTIAINVGANVKVTGAKPLILLATTTITIDGTLDLASTRGSNLVGAGGNPAVCDNGTGPNNSGGGAGGSFAGAGGNGGDGAGGANNGTAGAPAAAITELRGGCRGQDGKEGTGGAATHGIGGNGGGTVYLIATTSISIGATGSINASGAGATGGTLGAAGAGGGGSGGLLGFDSPAIANTGLVFANGGGGGEGSGATSVGDVGDNPNSTAAAAGGSGLSASGGDGGPGGAGATATGTAGVTGTNGGGGGGGSAGAIKVFGGGTLGGQVSPTPS